MKRLKWLRKKEHSNFTFKAFLRLGFFVCYKSGTEKDKNHKVSIKIESDDGEYWIFSPEVKEIHIERTYDGQEHHLFVAGYQFGEVAKNNWLAPPTEKENFFQESFFYTDSEGHQRESQCLKEKGEYVFCCSTDSMSDLGDFKSVRLYITVK